MHGKLANKSCKPAGGCVDLGRPAGRPESASEMGHHATLIERNSSQGRR
jgi:hypothetical protein